MDCRVQVSLYTLASPFRDVIVNTFYLRVGGDLGLGPDSTLAEDTAALWASEQHNLAGYDRVQVRIYDMAAIEPRPIIEEHTATRPYAAPGPREVALCLSFFAERNLPRNRGRLFFGAWSQNQMTERPATGTRQQVANFAEALSGLGGVNVQWCQHSPTAETFKTVTDYYVDNEWDTMRSRGLRADARTVGTVDG